MKFKVHSSIGGPSLYLEDDDGFEIARIRLPAEEMHQLAFYAVREVIHGDNEEHKKFLADAGIYVK